MCLVKYLTNCVFNKKILLYCYIRMSNNSNFLSIYLNNSILDLMSGTSDSYPIGPIGPVTDGLIYGSFMCVGDLLIQFSSNQSNSTVLTGVLMVLRVGSELTPRIR